MKNVFIFHGTEGYPEENWFPWLKGELEKDGIRVFVPQFPSPPIVASKVSKWFDVFGQYKHEVNSETILIGHSLGGIFALRVLEQLDICIHAAFFVGTPIGVNPILNFDRDSSFSGFEFDWQKIKQSCSNFYVYHSDNDPYVGLENGKTLAKNLGVELTFIPNAGHFNSKAGYLQFPDLLENIEKEFGLIQQSVFVDRLGKEHIKPADIIPAKRKTTCGVAIKGNKILLIQSKNFTDWEIPGGKVEDGETLEEGLGREILEETGYKIAKIGKNFLKKKSTIFIQ